MGKFNSGNGVVRIDLRKVYSDVEDVSKGFGDRSHASKNAIENREVLIRGHIPQEAIQTVLPPQTNKKK